MKTYTLALIKILVLEHLIALCASQNFDFFYFVQMWPGSYCDTKRSCCYPTTGKPEADFGIHGLWPNYNNGSWPANCNPNNPYNQSAISDLIPIMEDEWPTLSCPSNNGTKFWAHEWNKHGTCSESVFDQHSYFQTNLYLKNKIDLLEVLKSAGIHPNGTFYKLNSIREAIKGGIGYTPEITCNVDAAGNSQLYEVFLCVDTGGTKLIECSILPKEKCASEIEFPSFEHNIVEKALQAQVFAISSSV